MSLVLGPLHKPHQPHLQSQRPNTITNHQLPTKYKGKQVKQNRFIFLIWWPPQPSINTTLTLDLLLSNSIQNNGLKCHSSGV